MKKKQPLLKPEFTEDDKEKLIIFLSKWFGHGLLITQMTKEVVTYMREQFNIEYKDFAQTLIALKEKGLLRTELDGKQTFTPKGKDYLLELIDKHGDFPLNINWTI